MRVLVLGGGAREHTLCWKLARSSGVDEVVCAPGSDAIAQEARIEPVDATDPASVVELARRIDAGLVVVGPEAPLAAGVADALEDAGFPVFGPRADAARLESSKSFAKAFMARHGIPTAAHAVFDDPDEADRYVDAADRPLVVKGDGLAAGKAVTVCDDAAQAKRAIDEAMRQGRFGASGARVVIEERLTGEEVSYYAICDGERFVCLTAAQDYKPALDGDRGENTGGIGAYSPVPLVDAETEKRIVERVVRPVFDGIRAEGHPYRGVLYCGLMVCDGEPFVIEFNARFGDPETQVILPRLEGDLLPLLLGAARGRLDPDPEAYDLRFGDPAVCVVMASKGYPRDYPTGLEITGLAEVGSDAGEDTVVFHAGTRHEGGRWLTAGGRVLGVTARGPTLAEARSRAYAAVERIRFDGAQYRSDVGAPGRVPR